ncbi:MAG: ClpXP protease specificity-enhancing factor SspB [Parvularculaceae bacterium]
MAETTHEGALDYGALTQTALKGVVRAALARTAELGAAPGGHHFYITFATRAPGVQIADFLIEQYPEEMTIVLQHQFWDLEVDDEKFSVLLKFRGKPERLVIPFRAISKFFDPEAQFGLQFDIVEARGAAGGGAASGESAEILNLNAPAREESAAGDGASDAEGAGDGAGDGAGAPSEAAGQDDADPKPSADRSKPAAKPDAPDDADSQAAEIVSLDQFRKK